MSFHSWLMHDKMTRSLATLHARQLFGKHTHHSERFAGLDYLSYPTGVIQQAQELAANAFGAEQSWFLVNGTTAGRPHSPPLAWGAEAAPNCTTLPTLSKAAPAWIAKSLSS